MRRSKPGWQGAVLVALLICRAPSALAGDDDKAPAAPSEVPAAPLEAPAAPRETNAQKLAREFSDPLTTLPQLFVQDAYTPANYGTDAQTNRVIVRAIIPRVPKFTLLPFVQLIRPSFFLNTVPIPPEPMPPGPMPPKPTPSPKATRTKTEFGDMQLLDVAVLPWPSRDTGLLMGIGPVFVFPTATDKRAGQGAWQVGPTFAAIYKGVPWLLVGCLIQNPVSFAYTSSDRKPVNTLLIQPIVLLSAGGGWYVKSADSTWTMGWHDNTPIVLPLSFGVGRVLLREGWPPLNLFVSGEWTAYRNQSATVAPQTTVRFGMTVAFPDFRPWH